MYMIKWEHTSMWIVDAAFILQTYCMTLVHVFQVFTKYDYL